MKTKTYTEDEYKKLSPIRSRWYKHKEKNVYAYQINFLEINQFQEVF